MQKKKREIKVYMIHHGVSDLNRMIDYLCIHNKELTDRMVWEKENPDYVIVSENIYRIREQFLQFKKYLQRKDRIFIASIGECISADMNLFDYAISYEKGFAFSDRVGRIPPMYIFHNTLDFKSNQLTKEKAVALLNEKKKFCNFIYSNPCAHPKRDRIFLELSKYKKVDSLGAHLNNTHVEPTRSDKHWGEISVQLKNSYKFSIAAENAVQSGYNSEKIMSSFAAHTVPIYFGDPSIDEEYNPKAFINANLYDNLSDLVEEVKRIDQNDELWLAMVCEPWQTDAQLKEIKKNMELYQDFINHIFTQDRKAAKRVTVGTHHDIYVRWFLKRFSYEEKIKQKIMIKKYQKQMEEKMRGML